MNFAGRYVLATIGCGAGCLTLGAIDTRSGKVVELAPTLCCWPDEMTEPLRYRADSRLLVAHGELNESGKTGLHRFVLTARGWVRVPFR